MTALPPALHLTLVDAEDRVRIEITGDLDYDNSDLLLEQVTLLLDDRPQLRDLHLHCAGIGSVDSMGLSVLLMIGRRTAAAKVQLHLDDRTPQLDRLLDITGTLAYFTAALLTDAAPSDTAHAPETEGHASGSRPRGPDGTT
ncbi:STAS domain-containing protein [Streptomyces sp. NPDC058657]|uniref:STAS domain-containing protein n=1 Tax=unclassified Streptomyces TaxID=2593676 RepID=UPI003647994A